MLSEFELRSRIASIGETQKITGAMYLIASNELRRAKDSFNETRPYFELLRAQIKRIFRCVGSIESRYLYPADGSHIPDGTHGILVITSDKGLAGSYNMNVIREAERALKEHPNSKIYAVGSFGKKYFAAKKIKVEDGFEYSAQNPTLHRARKMAYFLLERFEVGDFDKLFVIYTHFHNDAVMDVRSERILPFHRGELDDGPGGAAEKFSFYPSPKTALEATVPSYVCGYIYSALSDSYLSEQRSRMAAMESADKSARDMLEELDFEYNRLRQSEITREITEISAAARFQREQKTQKEE